MRCWDALDMILSKAADRKFESIKMNENFEKIQHDFVTTDIQREFLEDWADKWMSRGLLSRYIDVEGGELNYVRFEIGRNGIFHCILYCSNIFEISEENAENIKDQIEWKLDDIENEIVKYEINNDEIEDYNICIVKDD